MNAWHVIPQRDRVRGHGGVEILDSDAASFEVRPDRAECPAHLIPPVSTRQLCKEDMEAAAQADLARPARQAGQRVLDFRHDRPSESRRNERTLSEARRARSIRPCGRLGCRSIGRAIL